MNGLRDYQVACLDAIQQEWSVGVSKGLVVLPTGTGKTKLFANLPLWMGMRCAEQMLVLVNRSDLVYQSAEKIAQANPTLRVDIEKADERCDPAAHIVVASVQSIGQATKAGADWIYGDRLRKFGRDQFRYIVIDEAHTAIKSLQYNAVLRYFRCYKPEAENNHPGRLLTGWTATPGRSDALGLERLFDKITFSRSLREMIEAGWLAPIRAWRISTDVDISNVSTREGDFAVGELTNTVNTPERNELIVRKYKELAPGTKALCFTVNIAHAEDLAEAFERAGVHAHMVCGETSRRDRKLIYDSFEHGHTMVLTSAGVLNVGLDLPIATTAICAGPTKSALKYQQSLGRVLRPFPSPEDLRSMLRRAEFPPWKKEYAIVLDFCDLTGHHSIQTVPSLFGLRAHFDLEGANVVDVVKKIEQLEILHPSVDLREALSLDQVQRDIKHSTERVDLFRAPVTPPQVKRYSKFGWLQTATGYQLVVVGTLLTIVENQLGQFEVYHSRDGRRTLKFVAPDLPGALYEADGMVPQKEAGFMRSDAQWHSQAPTIGQMRLLYKFDRKLRGSYASAEIAHADFLSKFKAGNQDYCSGGVSKMIDLHMVRVKQRPQWLQDKIAKNKGKRTKGVRA